MRDRSRRRPMRRAALVALVAGGMVAFSAAPTAAEEDTDPLKQVTDQINEVVDKLLKPPAPAPKRAEQQAAAPVQDDDDSPGYETQDPAPPDHGSSQGLSADLAGNDLASVGTTDSRIEDDHSASADATTLAIAGQEILGAHADSGGTEEDEADPLAAICEGTSGAICASVLYAEAEAHEGQTTSDSSARSGVASACLGGTGAATCDGPVGVGVLDSWSEISRDGSGHTEASSGSSVADVCLGPVLGACTVGAQAVSSEGSSDSRGSASKESQVIGLQLGGPLGDFTEPTAISIPPGCTSPSVACVFLNQGETYLGNGIAGHGAIALNASVLDGVILADAAQSETLVHKAGSRSGPGGPGDGPGGPGDGDGGPGAGGPGAGGPAAGDGDAGAGVLPDAGGVWSGLLAIGLFTIALGGFCLAWARRRDPVDAAA
ncbi:hypothetical protein [Nocardioides sp. SYSU DS0651]|uniref:hypothetical protein n=1 Tax=Nocardioides sp. SYSU DS0651 TaxID=3415955 RepID=UPI003F4BF060